MIIVITWFITNTWSWTRSFGFWPTLNRWALLVGAPIKEQINKYHLMDHMIDPFVSYWWWSRNWIIWFIDMDQILMTWWDWDWDEDMMGWDEFETEIDIADEIILRIVLIIWLFIDCYDWYFRSTNTVQPIQTYIYFSRYCFAGTSLTRFAFQRDCRMQRLDCVSTSLQVLDFLPKLYIDRNIFLEESEKTQLSFQLNNE